MMTKRKLFQWSPPGLNWVSGLIIKEEGAIDDKKQPVCLFTCYADSDSGVARVVLNVGIKTTSYSWLSTVHV